MEAVLLGIGTAHARGRFCQRRVGCEFFISRFLTPFLYEKNGALVGGEAGDMLILPPYTPVYHGPLPSAQEGFVNDWLYLRGDDFAELLQRYPLPIGEAFPAPLPGAFRQYLKNVKRECALPQAGSPEKILYWTGQLIIDLYRALRRGDLDPDPLAQTREAMLHSPERSWDLAELAARSGYSVSRFSSLYRMRFGISPKQDLLHARLRLACNLLRYGGMTVSEVAYACGFGSIYYFSNYFKSVMGVSPKTYGEQDGQPL